MSRDRRAGVVLVVIAALAFGIVTATSDSVLPPVRHDATAYAELLSLLDANESGAWIVDYQLQRSINNGNDTTAAYTEARAEGVHIVTGGGSADATIGDTRYHCTETEDDGTLCSTAPATKTLSSSEIVRTAVDIGAYVVTRLPDETIAGEHAKCYSLFGAEGFVTALGIETEYCFAADGVQLRTKITTVNDVRNRVANRVERDPPDAALEEVLRALATEPGSADDDRTN